MDCIKVSVVMPVHNAERFLAASLQPLCAFYADGLLEEIIVVDDASDDRSAEIAEQFPVTLLSNSETPGVCFARNAGAKQASGEVLWFVDADVVVHTDAIHQLRLAFARPGVDAVIGSYDDQPQATNFLSQYKNLLHHYLHQSAGDQASHFWSGCGAIRKSIFVVVGGFDAQRFPHPSVEDIELGYRLRDNGANIVIDRQLQGCHLKHWTLLGLLHTEVFRRAIPWSRLLVERTSFDDQFNISRRERWRALSACIGWFALAMCLLGLWPAWLLLVWPLVALTSNSTLFDFFRTRRGTLFALRALVFHQVYYLYSVASYVAVWILSRLRS